MYFPRGTAAVFGYSRLRILTASRISHNFASAVCAYPAAFTDCLSVATGITVREGEIAVIIHLPPYALRLLLLQRFSHVAALFAVRFVLYWKPLVAVNK